MLAGDLIVEARRRAGLTQQQLADRLERPQSTVARWERGVQAPSIDTTREIVRACGLELTVGLARYDDSYVSLIDAQLRLSPRERLLSLCRPVGFDPLAVLTELLEAGVRFVLVGRAAGALQGSPLVVSPPELVVVSAEECENQRAFEATLAEFDAKALPLDDPFAGLHAIEPWLLPDGSRVAAVRTPAGTRGFRDLRRDAAAIELGGSLRVLVASLLDLVRIAEASPRLGDRGDAVALRATLERGHPSARTEPRAPQEIVASWQRPRI